MESSVIQRVNQIYLSLALDSSVNLNINTLQGNHIKILDIQQLLKNQVQNHSDLIQAIHLYDAQGHYLISSVYGLLLYDSPSANTTYVADWIHAMKETEESSLWMKTRMVPQDAYTEAAEQMIPLISYIHSYPFQASKQSSKLMIAIDIKETAVSNIIQTMLPIDYEHTFIVDENGTVISAADKSMLGQPAKDQAFIQSLLSYEASDESSLRTFDYGSSVISHDQFNGNGWRMYTTTPTESFYYKMDGLKEGVLILCLVVIIVGIGLSSIFTAAGYSPLKRIMNTIKSRHDSPISSKQNEYRIIDTAINRLSNKVDSLEETLQANYKMIKHNVLLNILNNRFTLEEMTEELQSIQVSMDYTYFCCMIIDPISEKWKELHPRQLQHTLYSMIHQLETAEFAGTQLFAEELQDHKMVVIICTNQSGEQLSDQIADFILSNVRTQFGLEFSLSLGSWVQQLTDIHTSYQEAKTLIKYSYFFPDQSVISNLELLDREASSLELSDSYLMNFEKKLQTRDLDGTVQAIEHIILALKQEMYSAEYSRIILLKMISIYSDCMIQMRWQPAEMSTLNLYKQYGSIFSINRYSEWMIGLVTEFVQHIEKRNEVRSIDTVHAVKAYVREHLSDDLTLDQVSEQVFISPKYLSKIFKEETGVAYSEYVTSQRMERACELMKQRDMTVEQVANTVGYRTPAYFIKKFKEIHGCTPKNFMRGLMN